MSNDESSGWDQYEASVLEPIPLPDFYDIGRCWNCHKQFGFFRHHIRVSQNRVPMIKCPYCRDYTRVELKYEDQKIPMRDWPQVRIDITTGKELYKYNLG